MIFGIFELSSLVFISALESVQVFARFALSIVLCQIVLQVELAVIRAKLQQRKAYPVPASIEVPGSEAAIADSQGGTGERIPLHGLTEGTRSQRSGESHEHSVQVTGSPALDGGSSNTT
jgi:hypothetical protein